jgi:hypothetical protein
LKEGFSSPKPAPLSKNLYRKNEPIHPILFGVDRFVFAIKVLGERRGLGRRGPSCKKVLSSP